MRPGGFPPDTAGARLGPFWIARGWSRGNAATVWLASLLTIGLAAFMSFVQPYVLNEMRRVPPGEQGALTGNLAALQELIIIGLASLVGAWSDRVGRRRVYCLGFLAMAAGYAVYPLAGSVAQLYLLRCVFAVGVAVAPVMLSACVVDAAQEVSRGRWIASNNLLQGLGVVLMSVLLAKAPAWFRAQLRSAAAVARANPRMGLAYGAAFIGRGDFTVIGVFFPLWTVQAGLGQGMAAGAALARAGMLFGIVQGAAMAWAFFMGMIADRSDRVSALAVALTLATAGYLAMGGVADPFAPRFVPVAVLLGVGEVSVIVAGGALLGQEVPAEGRGPLVGFYNAIGGVGILFATYAGGQLFDTVGRAAPFTMMGLLNLALLAAALLVRARTGRRRPAAGAAATGSNRS